MHAPSRRGAQVKFAVVDGAQLFGLVQGLAQGGPRTLGLYAAVCADISAAA